MTREKQIQLASVENADKVLAERDSLDFAINALADFDNGLTMGFTAGATWADETMIDKACLWLRETAHFYVSDFTGELDDNGLIEDFKKAMEE